MLLDSEKYLCAPFPPNTIAGDEAGSKTRPGAFKHRNLGLAAPFLKAPKDASAEAAARTALCILIVVGAIGFDKIDYLDTNSNFFPLATSGVPENLSVT